jgi:2-dehydro-3-deoxyphosphogluconate aldolase/(4S)-4-hydroxy-2-oxoglutarate aldolase
MTKAQVRAQIDEVAIIPSIRATSTDDAMYAAETVALGGIPIVEMTMTVPGALDVIARIRREQPGMVVGAGTVLDLTSAKRCQDAGAMFLTSPGLVTEVVEFAAAADIVAMPGALTPTEVLRALRSGADYIKIFPCAQVGGPAYIRALKGPFPQASFIASGGVTQQNAADYIVAGATAVGIGEHLVPHKAVIDRKADWIQELARRFNVMIKRARDQRAAHPASAHAEFGD